MMGKSGAGITLLVTIFLIGDMDRCAMASDQQVIFYKGENCSGDSESITESQEDLSKSWVTDALSMRVVGIWKINIKIQETVIPIINDRTNAPDGRCVNRSEWNQFDWKNCKIVSADMLGPNDTATGQVIFFTLKGFTGQQYAVGGDKRTTIATSIQSYIHFSNDVWTVYPEEDFQGKPIYLYPSGRHEEQVENETVITYPNKDGFAYQSSKLIYVGSVKKGEIEYDYSSGIKATVASAFLLIVSSLLILLT